MPGMAVARVWRPANIRSMRLLVRRRPNSQMEDVSLRAANARKEALSVAVLFMYARMPANPHCHLGRAAGIFCELLPKNPVRKALDAYSLRIGVRVQGSGGTRRLMRCCRGAGVPGTGGPAMLCSDHDQSFPERFDTSRVENRLVSFRAIHLTPVATAAAAGLLSALLWLAAPVAIGRLLRPWEALLVAAAILALLEWWRGRRLRRQREQIESLRDSALW